VEAYEAGRGWEAGKKKGGFQLQLDFHTRNLPPAHVFPLIYFSHQDRERESTCHYTVYSYILI